MNEIVIMTMLAKSDTITIDQGINLIEGYLRMIRRQNIRVKMQRGIDGGIVHKKDQDLFEHAVTVASNFFNEVAARSANTFRFEFHTNM